MPFSRNLANATGDGLENPQRILAFVAVALALSIAVISSALINIALPTIAKDFGVDAGTAIWSVTAYQFAITIALLPLGFLGDSYGYRRVHLTGVIIFVVTSVLCGLADTFWVFVALRFVQGLAAAGILGVNIALVRSIYPTAMLARGISNTALVVAISTAIGPTITSLVLQFGDWRLLFFGIAPLGGTALAICYIMLPITHATRKRLDWISTLLNGITLLFLVGGLERLGSAPRSYAGYCLIAAAAFCAWIFLQRQRHTLTPLLPLDLFRKPVFALSISANLMVFAAQALIYLALPFHFHDILGFSILKTGLLMTAFPLAIACAAPFSANIAARTSPAVAGSSGLLILACALASLAILSASPTDTELLVILSICGFGFGLFQPPNNHLILTSAPRTRAGAAGGVFATARQLGQTTGAALVGIVFTLNYSNDAEIITWIACGLICLALVLSSLRIGKMHVE